MFSQRRLFGDGGFHEDGLRPAYLEPITTICRLKIINLAAHNSQNALYRRGYVFMKAIRKFDDDNRALAWCSEEPAGYSATWLSSNFAQNDLHKFEASTARGADKRDCKKKVTELKNSLRTNAQSLRNEELSIALRSKFEHCRSKMFEQFFLRLCI